jgi:outer membrane PBP1 activator LpoA protein
MIKTINHVDLSFMEARSKLLDIAAYLDRVQRYQQEDDFRHRALVDALNLLIRTNEPKRAKELLLLWSDLSEAPIEKATTQAACGAVPPV